MNKFSYEEKLEAVTRVLEDHISYLESSRILGANKEDIRKWVRYYELYGPEGLMLHEGNYAGVFKQHVIEYMHEHKLSYFETALKFKIPSKSLLFKWEHIYYEEGPEALYIERRGRKPKMSKETKPRKKQLKPDVEEDLIKENQRLRMENEYLKKLNALVQERIKRESGKE